MGGLNLLFQEISPILLNVMFAFGGWISERSAISPTFSLAQGDGFLFLKELILLLF